MLAFPIDSFEELPFIYMYWAPTDDIVYFQQNYVQMRKNCGKWMGNSTTADKLQINWLQRYHKVQTLLNTGHNVHVEQPVHFLCSGNVPFKWRNIENGGLHTQNSMATCPSGSGFDVQFACYKKQVLLQFLVIKGKGREMLVKRFHECDREHLPLQQSVTVMLSMTHVLLLGSMICTPTGLC